MLDYDSGSVMQLGRVSHETDQTQNISTGTVKSGHPSVLSDKYTGW